MSEATDRRRSSDNALDQIDARLQRMEDKIDARFERLEQKLDDRTEWERQMELRMAEVEGKLRIATWVIATVAVIVIAGGLSLFWGLLTNAIEIGPHVAATLHP